ncbi:hypothetical protein PV327_011649, partial [Microctonus hyperodae]
MRTGLSYELIRSVLGLERPQQVSDFSDSILKSFAIDVLPTRFGIKSCTRQLLLENTAPIAKHLHEIKDDEVSLVCNETYLRHQKSSNNDYQRKSYSGKKKVPLTKPFTICTTNGFIVDIMGPYTANMNDAQIMEEIISDETDISALLEKNDAFFVDREFRDVQKKLEEHQYRVFMPALKGQRNQLSVEESNGSRKVTLVRWVFEAVHGIIEMKYKLLYNAGLYCRIARIAGFLVNQFGKRCISELSTSSDILEQIRKQSLKENSLAVEVDSKRLNRRKIPFQRLTSGEILDFPELTEGDLK